MRKLIVIFFIFFLNANLLWAEEKSYTNNKDNAGDIARIEQYLNSLTTVVSTFVQKSPDGNVAEGTFYLSRPGKLRWQYDPPSPITIVAKGNILAYYDAELNQVSHVSIDSSIAGFLTRKKINFDDDVKVNHFKKDDKKIYLSLIKNGKPEEGQLTLIFNNKSLELDKMIILDPTGAKTEVVFNTSVFGKPLGKDLFKLPKKK